MPRLPWLQSPRLQPEYESCDRPKALSVDRPPSAAFSAHATSSSTSTSSGARAWSFLYLGNDARKRRPLWAHLQRMHHSPLQSDLSYGSDDSTHRREQCLYSTSGSENSIILYASYNLTSAFCASGTTKKKWRTLGGTKDWTSDPDGVYALHRAETAAHASLCAALPTNVDERARRPTRVFGHCFSTCPRHRLGCIRWCSREGRGQGLVWTQCSRSALRTLVDAYPCLPISAMACLSLQAARSTRGDVRAFALARRPRRCAIALASVFGEQLVARARCVVVPVAVAVEPLAWQGARENRDADAGRLTHAKVARKPAGPGRRQPGVPRDDQDAVHLPPAARLPPQPVSVLRICTRAVALLRSRERAAAAVLGEQRAPQHPAHDASDSSLTQRRRIVPHFSLTSLPLVTPLRLVSVNPPQSAPLTTAYFREPPAAHPTPHHAPADPFLPVDLKLPEELAADAPMPISPGDVLVPLHCAHRAGGLGTLSKEDQERW
ncbi:hypothetical protein DFH08DRAFT_959987 [Mycena albidolilacea]|uniref:Uncharacterized protein n=1 Tax=Mycena albidolilacea TaxID=1033008 RepID=A0AAD7A363_9AGAR|nr:hypothetical protein DFH08DRAFT_959987 [Mycena albidolilacea]